MKFLWGGTLTFCVSKLTVKLHCALYALPVTGPRTGGIITSRYKHKKHFLCKREKQFDLSRGASLIEIRLYKILISFVATLIDLFDSRSRRGFIFPIVEGVCASRNCTK